MPIGTAIIDFGAFPGKYEASVVVTGQAAIVAESVVDPYVMANDTAGNHTAKDHRALKLVSAFTAGDIVAATGFTIFGVSTERLQGLYALRWVWF
jgi:hypothetical protein